MSKQSTGWRIEEPGWWTHDTLGGVCRESDGRWYGYRKHEPETDYTGPFKTAREAVASIEQYQPRSHEPIEKLA
jgi:hypothetical protein